MAAYQLALAGEEGSERRVLLGRRRTCAEFNEMSLSITSRREIGSFLLWPLMGCYLGLLIIRPDPYLSLISLSIPLGAVLFKGSNVGFFIIMLSVFFADWPMQLGLLPSQMTLLPEAVLLVLVVKVALSGRLVKTPIDILVLLFIFWSLISMLANSGHIIPTLLAFRFDLKFMLMFVLLVNLNPDERFLRLMMRALIFLLLIQVPVALVKLAIYGQGERAVGTYAADVGTHSTILPLIAISIFLGLFLFERPRWRYIFFSLLLILFSIVGGKRAFVFFGVLLFLFLLWQAGRKNLIRFSFAAPFLVLGFGACIYFVPSLNPTFEDIHHLIDFPVSYSTSYSAESGKAVGRASALQATHSAVMRSPNNLLFGFGPGSMSKSYFKEFEGVLLTEGPVEYGESQWVITSLESGYVGAILLLALFIPMFNLSGRLFNNATDKYWKAISFGFKGICFSYLMGFFYCGIFRTDVFAFIFWFVAGTMYCLERQRNTR